MNAVGRSPDDSHRIMDDLVKREMFMKAPEFIHSYLL